jgi:hypothetical protein
MECGLPCRLDRQGIDDLLAQHTKKQDEDKGPEAESETLKNALDSHTVENQQKRKAIQEKRDQLATAMKALAVNALAGQEATGNLRQSIETALALATHAEGWEWQEVEPQEK